MQEHLLLEIQKVSFQKMNHMCSYAVSPRVPLLKIKNLTFKDSCCYLSKRSTQVGGTMFHQGFYHSCLFVQDSVLLWSHQGNMRPSYSLICQIIATNTQENSQKWTGADWQQNINKFIHHACFLSQQVKRETSKKPKVMMSCTSSSTYTWCL